MPGLRVQAVAGLRGQQATPGCRCRRRDRRRHRPGRRRRCRPAPSRPIYKPEFGNFADLARVPRRRRPEGRAASGAAAGHARADPPGRRSSSSPPSRVFGMPVVATIAGTPAPVRLQPTSFGLPPSSCGSRSSRRRATATSSASSPRSRAAAAVGRHRQPHRRLRRRRPRWRRPARPTPRSSRPLLGAQERPAQQLPGLPGVPRQRRPHRPAARPAAVRRLPAQPVPGAGRAGPDARRAPGRGRRHQELTSACRRTTPPARSSSSARSSSPGHQGIWREPLRTGKYTLNPRIYEAEIVPTSILTLNWSTPASRGPQPRRAPVPDRRQEPRGLRLHHRPAGADPRARHQGAEGHLDGRHDAEPGQRGAAVGGRQPLPQQAADARGDRFIETRDEVQAAAPSAITELPVALRGRDARRLHPGRRVPRASSSRC